MIKKAATQADGTYNRVLRLNSIAIDIDDDGAKELVINGIELEFVTISSGYEIYSNDKKLPPKTRYSIRDQIYNGWDEIPDDYRATDDVMSDTREKALICLAVTSKSPAEHTLFKVVNQNGVAFKKETQSQ